MFLFFEPIGVNVATSIVAAQRLGSTSGSKGKKRGAGKREGKIFHLVPSRPPPPRSMSEAEATWPQHSCVARSLPHSRLAPSCVCPFARQQPRRSPTVGRPLETGPCVPCGATRRDRRACRAELQGAAGSMHTFRRTKQASKVWCLGASVEGTKSRGRHQTADAYQQLSVTTRGRLLFIPIMDLTGSRSLSLCDPPSSHLSCSGRGAEPPSGPRNQSQPRRLMTGRGKPR